MELLATASFVTNSLATVFCTILLLTGVRTSAVNSGVRDVNDDPHRRLARAAPSGGVGRPTDWKRLAQEDLADFLQKSSNSGRAKNVILFLGDGMGPSTVTAARWMKAQRTGQHISETKLSWETFPYTGLSKTYNTNAQTPDSAGTATAFLCGEKAQMGVIGVNERVARRNCSAVKGNEQKCIVYHSIQEEKWTGIVTNMRITHATMSSSYAHAANRDWESDANIPEKSRGECKDIAHQLVHGKDNSHIRVIFGGGRKSFLPEDTSDPEYTDKFGSRKDGVNLIEEWLRLKENNTNLPESSFRFVKNLTEFNSLRIDQIQYVLGLLDYDHLQYESDRISRGELQPSLASLTETAIKILRKGDKGFFLLVEGGLIDYAHHVNNAHRALTDTLAFSEAVDKAVQITDEKDTLIIVTADHSHAFTMAGYPSIDNDILGVADDHLGDDKQPYLTLSYANGPGFQLHRNTSGVITPRKNLTGIDTKHVNFAQDASVPLQFATHGGEDVAIYARGPMSHLLTGVHEQHYIAHVMMYASCVGWNKNHCASRANTLSEHVNVIRHLVPQFILISITVGLII